MHNYYKLASTVTECKREGILSAQKLEEIKQRFCMEVGETYATEAQAEDGSTVQEREIIEVNFLVKLFLFPLHYAICIRNSTILSLLQTFLW